MSGSSLAIDISSISGGERETRSDWVAVEEPLEIQLAWPGPDGSAAKSISVTMRTPGHDTDLALGFLFSESIISRASDIASVMPVGPGNDDGYRNVLRVELGEGVSVDTDRLQRHFYTTSSCGVCGHGRDPARQRRRALLAERTDSHAAEAARAADCI